MPDLTLTNRHLIISADIAQPFLGENSHVNMVYYAQRGALLMAPANDELFKGLHKTSMQMIKNKTLAGDKSISLEELLIDNDIDDSDRALAFKLDEMIFLQVYF